MSFSAGVFSLVGSNPVVTGATISSTWANNTLSDIADNGLSLCVTRNGQSTITANIPMSNFKLTGVGVATAVGDALTAQAWTTPAFDAGNFTANASMTWTVASGDVTVYTYIINGKMMTVNFSIETTTVGGTPSTRLQIAIPASKVSTKLFSNTCVIYDNSSSVRTAGLCQIDASGTAILIALMSGSNFAASTNLTYVYGSVTFEIN